MQTERHTLLTVDGIECLIDANGREIAKPKRADFTTDLAYLDAFHAHKDLIRKACELRPEDMRRFRQIVRGVSD
jgi:hypothetical protein